MRHVALRLCARWHNAKCEMFDRLAVHLNTLADEVEKEVIKLTIIKPTGTQQ
jgi:hypothetical protein